MPALQNPPRQFRDCVPANALYVSGTARRRPMSEPAMIETALIESPCVKICTLDAQQRLCLGCGRTVDEIARWAGMTPEDRRRVMNALPERLAAFNASQEFTG